MITLDYRAHVYLEVSIYRILVCLFTPLQLPFHGFLHGLKPLVVLGNDEHHGGPPVQVDTEIHSMNLEGFWRNSSSTGAITVLQRPRQLKQI